MSATVTPAAQPEARTLDLRAAWDGLTPDDQAVLGMAAIAIGLSQLVTTIEEHDLPAWQTAADAKNTYFFDSALLEGADIAGAFVEAKVLGGDLTRLRPPSLAALDVRQCEECGCTDQCACEGGCHWIGPLRCSSCPEAV